MREQLPKAVFQKSVLYLCSKSVKKHSQKSSFLSEVIGFRPATLLKMNPFTGIFKRFCV